jgi:hypothetical protein
LATILEKSSAPGVSLHNSEVKCLFFTDDLCLLSPTVHCLQQNLDLLEQYCQTWALRSRSKGIRPKFSIGTKYLEYSTHYNYLGLKISSTEHLNEAVNELREKARRAFYGINILKNQIEIPINIWLKLIECAIEPISLHGSKVWGLLAKKDFTKWDTHPIETLHAEFCKNFLHVQRKTTNNAGQNLAKIH